MANIYDRNGDTTIDANYIAFNDNLNELTSPSQQQQQQRQQRQQQQQQRQPDISSQSSLDQNAHRFVYISFILSSFGDRMWEFAVTVFLLDLFPNTLLPASLFGLLENIAGITAGPYIGKYIDRIDRLKTLKLSIFGQNISICIASIFFVIGIALVNSLDNLYLYLIYLIIIICGMIIKCAGTMNKVALQKDWMVILAHGNSDLQLKLNGSMRRIDLTCSILAPLSVGLIATLINSVVAVIVVIVWSALSFLIELPLIQWVYHNIPALHHKVTRNELVVLTPAAAVAGGPIPSVPSSSSLTYFQSFLAYYHHPIFIPSVAYCLLYISVLNFGGIFTSYLKTRQLSDALLAVGRASAAIVGICATILLPFFVHRIFSHKINITGMFALWSQLICLIPTLLAFLFINNDDLFMIIIITSICLSRFGLWSFDLVETQIMQEQIEPIQAGLINGIQESLMNFMYLLSFLLTIIFYNPDLFVYPVMISFLAVLISTLLFTWYVCFQQTEQQHDVTSLLPQSNENMITSDDL